MTNKDDYIVQPRLTKRMYDTIEEKVVELYEKFHISKFPIDPFFIATQLKIKLIPYSKVNKEKRDCFYENGWLGFNFRNNKKGTIDIYYDDSDSVERQRFTVMHELGHIILDHKEDSDLAEICANYFASYALAPSPIVVKYFCYDYKSISEKFFVSHECACNILRRSSNWEKIPGKLKHYEMKLEELFV